MDSITIFPGDQITAYGRTYTVWSILYQDPYAAPNQADVEFIDPAGAYHHWKQCYDGGAVTRSGRPGMYFRTPGSHDAIGVIYPARTPGTYSVKLLRRTGGEMYLGRYGSHETALARLLKYLPDAIKM